MSFALAAELQVLLEGTPLPADREELVRYARLQRAEARFVTVLSALPDREYRSLDEVAEELAPVQPRRGRPPIRTPREPSDAVPGGADYSRVPADTGAVRDLEAATGGS